MKRIERIERKRHSPIGSGARRGSETHGEPYFLGWQPKSLQGLRSPRLSLPIKNQLAVLARDDVGIVGVVLRPFDSFTPFVSFHPTLLTLHDSALPTVKLEQATTLLARAAIASTD